MKVKVEAPAFMFLYGRHPVWERAWVDPGGTTIFGPCPYLKLRYTSGDMGRDWAENRIFAPPRIARCKSWKLVKDGDDWYWLTGKDAAPCGRKGGRVDDGAI